MTFITMEDETGLIDVVAFPKAQTRYAKAIWTSEVLTVRGRLQRQGKDGRSISIRVDEVILELSGPLSAFLPRARTAVTPEQKSPTFPKKEDIPISQRKSP